MKRISSLLFALSSVGSIEHNLTLPQARRAKNRRVELVKEYASRLQPTRS